MATMIGMALRGLGGMVIAAALLLGILSGGGSASAAGAAGLYGPFDDGCYYSWDGSAYILGLCPRTDGEFNVYVPQGGQWVYGGQVYFYSVGGYTLVTPDGTSTTVHENGTYWITYPDGSTATNDTPQKEEIRERVREIEGAAIDRATAPDCAYSYDGCW